MLLFNRLIEDPLKSRLKMKALEAANPYHDIETSKVSVCLSWVEGTLGLIPQ